MVGRPTPPARRRCGALVALAAAALATPAAGQPAAPAAAQAEAPRWPHGVTGREGGTATI